MFLTSNSHLYAFTLCIVLRKNNLSLARLTGISANSNENYRCYNFQAFANISRNFPKIFPEIIIFRWIHNPNQNTQFITNKHSLHYTDITRCSSNRIPTIFTYWKSFFQADCKEVSWKVKDISRINDHNPHNFCQNIISLKMKIPNISHKCRQRLNHMPQQRIHFSCTGFPLSCLQKIPGLSKTFFQNSVVAQQC